jgi:hypothetical protein
LLWLTVGLFVHKCARDAHERITRLWDFMSPTVVAMWNLRWHVQGFLQVKPDATQDELKQRFALGSEIRGRLRRASVEIRWEDRKARFSYILLTNSIAISSLIAAVFRLLLDNAMQLQRKLKSYAGRRMKTMSCQSSRARTAIPRTSKYFTHSRWMYSGV